MKRDTIDLPYTRTGMAPEVVGGSILRCRRSGRCPRRDSYA